MADGTTTILGLTKPEVGLSYNTWGEKINANLDLLDVAAGAIQPAQLVGAGPGLLSGNAGGTSFNPRVIAVGSGLDITDGDGIAGDPTISLDLTELAAKALPIDADEVIITDSAAALASKKATRTNFLKAALHTAPRRALSNLGAQGSASVALDLATADHFILECTGPNTIQLQNAPAGHVMEVTLILTLNGGSVTSFVNQTWLWPGGTVPTFTSAGTDVLKLLWTGSADTVIAWRAATDVS